jgi:hypothetical protein
MEYSNQIGLVFLFFANQMIAEEDLPGAAVYNKGLHHGLLGLDGVVQVVGGPFVEHLLEFDGTKLGVAGWTVKISRCDLFERFQGLLAQLYKLGCQAGRRLSFLGFSTLRVWVKGREIAPVQESLQTELKSMLGVDDVLQAFNRRPLLGRWPA